MTDWVEIAALIGGPTIAVGLTLWSEQRRQLRERRLGLMRQLLLTRVDASDPAFSAAVNLIPIEFGHDNAVMTAWEAFIHAAENQAARAEHVEELTKRLMLALGYSERASGQVTRSPYVSTGLSDQRRLLAGVLKGIGEIATASATSARAAEAMTEHITGRPLE